MAEQRSDPYRNFKFRIKWDGRYVAGVSKVSALKRTTEVIDVRQGSDPAAVQKVPGRVTFDPITLERGITRDREFEQWAGAASGAPGDAAPGNFRKDIVIELFNERGQLALAYHVHRCWVPAYQALPELDARGNAIAIEHITLQHEGWERDTSVVEPIDFTVAIALDPRIRLEGIADRVEARGQWSDLVLPAAELASLKHIAERMRQRGKVYGEWGFDSGSVQAGLMVLFAGPSGTGKTLAAEAIANDLALELFQVDVAAIVSKYVGETEKHMDRVFDAAAGSGAVLLLDEADALLGKRTNVDDSHDRFANLDVTYLLKRIERYDGLVILASNLKAPVDESGLHRLAVRVEFPFPDAAAREAIWRKVFPPATPVGRLDYPTLAQLHMTGGTIRRVAVDAAFRAAADERITMEHILAAARAIEQARRR